MRSIGYIVIFGASLLSLAAGATDALTTIDDIRVDAMVQSHWDQLYAGGNIGTGRKCYNYYTPNGVYCGCGPTALAQIMRYHRWPQTAVDTHYFVYGYDGLDKMVRKVDSYPCKYNGVSTNLTMVGGVYDWSLMPLTTSANGTSDVECEMIGRLCYDVGVSISSYYDQHTGTGSSSPAAVHCLPGNFHYADAAAIEFSLTQNMQNWTRPDFERAILPNLDMGLPCGIQIGGNEGAHIVVCDGYGYHQGDGKLYLHLNVGYSGKWDGWYALGDTWTLNGHDYTILKGFVYNISPHFNGPIISGRIVDAGGTPIPGAAISITSGGEAVTNLVADSQGRYIFKRDPGNYEVRVTSGGVSRTVYMRLEPCISTAYLQTGEYIKTPVAVRISNRINEDIVLDGALAQVAMPTSIPADGATFIGTQRVELYCDTDGAEIRYTTDGTYPDRESTRYTGPFEISQSAVVRAVAFKDGMLSSGLGTFSFVEVSYGKVLGCQNVPWTSGGFANWYEDVDGRDYTSYYVYNTDTKGRLRSGVGGLAGKGSVSWVEATVEGPATMSFDYRFWPYEYCSITVVTDGSVTNLYKKGGSYTEESSVEWASKTVEIGEGVHKVRIGYEIGGKGAGSGYNGIHLRNMKVICPNVLSANMPSYNFDWEWSLLTFTDGQRSGYWSRLEPSNAKVTLSGNAHGSAMIVDVDATLQSLDLAGRIKVTSQNGKRLSVGSVKVSGDATVMDDALDVTGYVTLTSLAATLTVADGVSLKPVSGVSGAKVVSTAVQGGTCYSLKVGYFSPFSVGVTGSAARWSELLFTDRNGNSAKWADLEAGDDSRLTLNVSSSTELTLDAAVTLRGLMVAGEGSLTMKRSGLGMLDVTGVTTVSAGLSLPDDSVRLGATEISGGGTLSVASVSAITSLTGNGTLVSSDNSWPVGKGLSGSTWKGTLRVSGSSLADGCDLAQVGNAGSTIAFAGALAAGSFFAKDMTCASTLSLESTLNIENGHSGGKCVFSGALTGTGAFAASKALPADGIDLFCFTGDVSGFGGDLSVSGHHAVVFGDCEPDDSSLRGRIVVPIGCAVTIAAGRTWTAENGISVGGELTVGSGASVVGGIEMTDTSARVVVKGGASAVPTSGVEHYEPVAAEEGGDTVYTLQLAKVAHTGPYSVTLSSAVAWKDIIWSDANGDPGVWADLESDGTDVFEIVADEDVTITMSGNEAAKVLRTSGKGRVTLLHGSNVSVSSGLFAALQDAAWTGIVKLSGTHTLSNADLGEWGNANSAVELNGYSIKGSLKPGGRCEAELILDSGATFTVTGGKASSTYTFAGKVSGSGEIYYDGYSASQAIVYAGDVSGFRGCANAAKGCILAIGDYTYAYADRNNVIVNSEFTYAGGTTSYINGSVMVYGTLTIESGASFKKIDSSVGKVEVLMCSPSARVLVKSGSGVVPVNRTSLELKSTKRDGGTLYYFDQPAGGMIWLK